MFDPATIDLVAQGPDQAVVALFIVPADAWTGSDREIASLQEKIHNYVDYALDGQMARDYPDTSGLPWTIVVHCQTAQ